MEPIASTKSGVIKLTMNGHIKMEKLQESRAKRDMHPLRGDALVKKAIMMENLTDCLAKLKVEPI